MLLKLKATYSLAEQLYAGTQCSLAALSGGKKPPTLIKTMLDQLSMVPAQIEEIKLSATRAGAIVSLSQAKACQSKLDPE